MISGEASIELKRTLKKMTPKNITALQSQFDSIDSSLESEKLLENAIPLDHTSGLLDSSIECQRALRSIHEDIDMEMVAEHAETASITQSECLLMLRRNQVARLVASFLRDMYNKSDDIMGFVPRISAFISVPEVLLIIPRNCC